MTLSALTDQEVVSFGPYELLPGERLLKKDGAPMEIGGRAIDLLVTLVARAHEVVGKRELLAQVWPDTTVDEGSLRFHISNLRKALGDGRDGIRLITTVPGRGYCFVAPIIRRRPPPARGHADHELPRSNLPGRLLRMVGRRDDVPALAAQVLAKQFVTVVGPGGVGKTALALTVGHDLVGTFDGVALYVELGTLADPGLVPTTVASLLGLSVPSSDPTPGLIAYLRDRHILIIFDTCEHVIEAVAALAARIVANAPRVHILATSREALRVEGEQVVRLEPLSSPPDDANLSVSLVQSFPAVELFLERAEAAGADLTINDNNAAALAAICRRLDGVPLALELAAGRVGHYGLQHMAQLLDDHFALVWPGQRTAPPRQRTLQATLDWSYRLLSDTERAVLRRLAIFVGGFTMEAALEILTDPMHDRFNSFSCIDSLVAKSMVAVRPDKAMVRYRLLDTTRDYLLRVPLESEDRRELAMRHAHYYSTWLNRSGTAWLTYTTSAERALHLAHIANARAAILWCFGPDGCAELGIRLAACAGPVLLTMSLLPECRRWSQWAIDALGETERSSVHAMRLHAAAGTSLMFMRGGHTGALEALITSLTIAEEIGETAFQSKLLGPLHMFYLRTGQFEAAQKCAERCGTMIDLLDDPAFTAMAHCILGTSFHLRGDLAFAQRELAMARATSSRMTRSTADLLGFESRSLSGGILARCLWLSGQSSEATALAREIVREAKDLDHPLSLAIALIWAATIFLWNGDLSDAEDCINELATCAEANGLEPYTIVARGLRGELAIRHGDPATGVPLLSDSLEALHAAPYELLTTSLKIALAEGLAKLGRAAEGMVVIEEALHASTTQGDTCYRPELLRIKSRIVRALHPECIDEARALLTSSISESESQGALSWIKRAADDLAKVQALKADN